MPVWRFLAGALACLLMVTGAFLIWQGHAQSGPKLPSPPPATASPVPAMVAQRPIVAPEATAKSREQKRFDRADKNKDGAILLDELLQPRRKGFAKLDKDGDGKLSFTEWAHSTIEKFKGADKDRSGGLTRSEYATTAPKPHKTPRCGC